MTFLTKFLRNVNDSNLKYHCKFQILRINVPGLFTLDIMLPTLSENECF